MKRPRQNSVSRSARANRRGAVLIFALVALMVISAIAAATLKTVIAQHRQAHREQRRLQSVWLAEAGLERAAARLAQDAGYKGETWEIPADVLEADKPGRVIIQVESADNPPARRLVTVTAVFPPDAEYRSRTEKQISVDPELLSP